MPIEIEVMAHRREQLVCPKKNADGPWPPSDKVRSRYGKLRTVRKTQAEAPKIIPNKKVWTLTLPAGNSTRTGWGPNAPSRSSRPTSWPRKPRVEVRFCDDAPCSDVARPCLHLRAAFWGPKKQGPCWARYVEQVRIMSWYTHIGIGRAALGDVVRRPASDGSR